MRLEDIFNNPQADEDLRQARNKSGRKRVTEEEHRKYVQNTFFETFSNWLRESVYCGNPKYYSSTHLYLDRINLPWTLADISEFTQNERHNDSNNSELGVFVSALINRVIKPKDELELVPREGIFDDNLCIFLERGTVHIRGDVNKNVAYKNSGGSVVVHGTAHTGYGDFMSGGSLVIDFVRGGGVACVSGGTIQLGTSQPAFPEIRYDFSLNNGIAFNQSGNSKIIIKGDIPKFVFRIGQSQEGGELIVTGTVHCKYINSNQSGGKTDIYGNVDHREVCIGHWKSNGQTIIHGDVKHSYMQQIIEREYSGYELGSGIGYMQEGGLIEIRGNVYGGVPEFGTGDAKLIVRGKVISPFSKH